jgi:2-succinyl-5-enolpyruvyl-6-hydroxy-3-cyclohexene-1-carboxylate synthase
MTFPNGLVDLVEILALLGVEDAVICPGSRNAPIMLALARNPKIKCYSISDERSAAFFALGLTLKSKKPTIVCCTSGSAGLNFAPAVVEAFFQEIPLIILTADRPKEWIGQWDGQTIYQENLYGKHVKGFWDFDTHNKRSDTEISSQITSIFKTSIEEPKGPVHINIPISEPFYPEINEDLPRSYLTQVEWNRTQKIGLLDEEIKFIQKHVTLSNKILVTVGQIEKNSEFSNLIKKLVKIGIPIIGDATANLPNECVLYHDLILVNEELWPELKPDLHIHFGKSFVTKRIKQFLRSNPPAHSWLIHPNPIEKPDPFQCLTKIFHLEATEFLNEFQSIKWNNSRIYFNKWINEKLIVGEKQRVFFKSSSWTEIHIFNYLTQKINQCSSDLHIANSLSVRYLNWTKEQIDQPEIFSNRGTSGIDGCLSTAVGASQINQQLTISIIGDVAFHYDKNALWNKFITDNLHIIIFNNQGGGIFRNLAGAKNLPELKEFMETQQTFTAENTAKDAQINYYAVKNWNELNQILPQFLSLQNKAGILEIFTISELNAEELKKYMDLFRS